MTPAERHAYLIKLGLEAASAALRESALEAPEGQIDPSRLAALLRRHMSERMAQAAQVWGGEVEDASP